MGEMKVIKFIPVIPFALIIGVISGTLGFLWALVISIIRLSALVSLQMAVGVSITGGIVGALLFIVISTTGAFIFGFITYALVAMIYNLLAPRIGGIKLELE